MMSWFLDPKSVTLMGMAAISVATSIWQGKQTAAAVAELVEWRLGVVEEMTRLRSEVNHNTEEISRLRDLRGKP